MGRLGYSQSGVNGPCMSHGLHSFCADLIGIQLATLLRLVLSRSARHSLHCHLYRIVSNRIGLRCPGSFHYPRSPNSAPLYGLSILYLDIGRSSSTRSLVSTSGHFGSPWDSSGACVSSPSSLPVFIHLIHACRCARSFHRAVVLVAYSAYSWVHRHCQTLPTCSFRLW